MVYFITSLLIWAFDDDIKDISDALWFTFASVTTIGYGASWHTAWSHVC